MSKKKTETGAEMIEIGPSPRPRAKPRPRPSLSARPQRWSWPLFDPARPAHQTMIEGVLANLHRGRRAHAARDRPGATEILVRSFTASAEQILSAAWGGQARPRGWV